MKIMDVVMIVKGGWGEWVRVIEEEVVVVLMMLELVNEGS